MPITSVRRPIAFLLFAALLIVAAWPSPAAGAQRPSIPSVQAGEWAVPEFVSRIWSFLLRVTSGEGCNIDPDGRCANDQNPPVQAKEGCGIDPNGRCLP